MTYPVEDIIPELKEKFREGRIVILQAPPGAGKSTVLPLKLLSEPWLGEKKIVLLEPRRLAAKAVAERMAQLSDEPVGKTIGYRIRFETKVSDVTKIEVVTEGILSRMIQSDNSLERVGLLVFDEFHERTLHADTALALSLQVQQVLRDDLRILIMSATMDSEQIASALNAPVVTSHGKQFPVQISYEAQVSDMHIAPRMAKAVRRALRDAQGDILAFLPGAGEIRRTQQILEEEGVDASVFTLYGDLSFKEQQRAILPLPGGKRKIVLATSIAETSLTIEGVGVVIDSGLSRVPRFDPRSGLTRLETLPVTKDSASQRTGRAGRLGPGVCFRLWTEGIQRNLIETRKPEILEADLAPMMLELACWGVNHPKELSWVTSPPEGAVRQAWELLTQLGAVDEKGITKRGREMVALPTHPRIAHLMSMATSTKSKALAADLAALLEERDPLEKNAGADLTLRIEALRKWRTNDRTSADHGRLERIDRLAANWRRLLQINVDNSLPGNGEMGRLLLTAYPERLARQQKPQGEIFTMANGRVVKLPDHDPLIYEPWLCAAIVDVGAKTGKIFLAAPVDEKDLLLLAEDHPIVEWDEERKMVAGFMEKRAGSVVLERRPIHDLDENTKNECIRTMIVQKGLDVLPWTDDSRTLQARMLSVRSWRPGEPWPDVSDGQLIRTLESWLTPYLTGVYKLSDIRKLDLSMIIRAMLPWDRQKKLDEFAPVSIPVPSGSMIRVQYFPDARPPVMEVRLQEMFGMTETPAVNGGLVKILLHLLSPGYKPVQVTQDLKSFWHTTYHEVRKELRMRYPKHSWPEDPWTAVAVRGVRKKLKR